MIDPIDGRTLMEAIERLLADPDTLREEALRIVEDVRDSHGEVLPDDPIRELAVDQVIGKAASASALSGGLTALAGVVPGLGTVLAAVGATTANIALAMKFQIEMTLQIATLFGFDIREEAIRKLGFLLVGMAMIDPEDPNALLPVAPELMAKIRDPLSHLSNQALQELFQHVGIVLAKKAAGRFIPFGIGVMIGYRANRNLCESVGRRARDHFASLAS